MFKQMVVGVCAVAAVTALVSCAANPQGGSGAQTDVKPEPSFSVADTAAGNFLAGRFAQTIHDLPSAASFLRSASREDPDDVEVLQPTYLALVNDGQLGDAAQVATRLLSYDPGAAAAAVIVIEQEVKAGNWQAAQTRVQALPKRGFNLVMVPLIGAWIEMGLGHPDKGLVELQALNADGHQAALFEFHAALICDLADRREEAEKHYRGALTAEGGDTLRTVQAAAAFFRRTGAPNAAKDLVARYRREHPEPPLVSLDGTSRPVDSPRAGLAEAFFALAGTLRQGSSQDLALFFDHLALDLEPDFVPSLIMAGDILQEMGRFDGATAMFRAIDSGSPAYWVAQMRIAGDYDSLGRVDDAIHTLEDVASRHPDRAQALIAMGDILRQHSRWSDAIAAYDRALGVIGKPERQDWSVLYARGIAEHEANQWDRAEGDFLAALQLDPEQPDVLNYLGYSWLEKGRNLDRASQMIQKALTQRPTDGFIVDSLGWVYFRTGMYEKAVAQLERAIELTPEDATINSHLGDALAAVGRIDEARFQWQRALIFNPDPSLKAELQKKLKDGFSPPPPIQATKDSAAQ